MTTNKVCGKGKCPFTDEFCASGDCPYDPDVLKNNENFNISEGNVKEDNINVANNVAQRNSQTLTAQWKKGELEFGKEYYVRFEDGEISTARWCYYTNQDKYGFDVDDIKEVLAPVLSFEECKKLQNSLEHEKMRATHYYKTLTEIEDENEKLEELLKECRDEMNHYIELFTHKKTFEVLLTKIDEVLK